MNEITLTVQQIKELAQCAGLAISTKPSELDDMDLEITIVETMAGYECIAEDGTRSLHTHVMYFHEYPEEGVCPLSKAMNRP